MKKLLITLLLISPFSFADWGDVYYCQMTANSNVSLEGETTNYTLEKFTFKLDKTKNAMIFGEGGMFDNTKLKIKEWGSHIAKEVWNATDSFSNLYFEKGKFLLVNVSWKKAITISANCDKF